MAETLNHLLADLTSGDDARAEAAALKFHTLGKKGFYLLAVLYASDNPDHRWWALRALTEFDNKKVINMLLMGLEDPDPNVQACAALGLRSHPKNRSIPQLISLLGDEDQLLSRLSRDALVAIGKESTPHLITLLEEPESSHQARLEAVRALSEIEDPASISTLFKVYQDGSSLMQHWAEDGLNKMGIGMVFFDPN